MKKLQWKKRFLIAWRRSYRLWLKTWSQVFRRSCLGWRHCLPAVYSVWEHLRFCSVCQHFWFSSSICQPFCLPLWPNCSIQRHFWPKRQFLPGTCFVEDQKRICWKARKGKHGRNSSPVFTVGIAPVEKQENRNDGSDPTAKISLVKHKFIEIMPAYRITAVKQALPESLYKNKIQPMI